MNEEEALLVMLEDGFEKKDIEIIEAAMEHFVNATLLVESVENDLELENSEVQERISEIKDTLDTVRKSVDVFNPPASRQDTQELLKKVRNDL